MAGNKNLNKAKDARKDEFYTRLEDIEHEVINYKEQFKGKVVYCNCDDPYESNFFKYFALNFNFLGLKRLICTSYVSSPVAGTQVSFFDDELYTEKRAYKVVINEVSDVNGDGAYDLADVKLLLKNPKNTIERLDGDGDFRSEECLALLADSDIICTNPPFSLWAQYLLTIIENNKQFLILGDMTALKYKDIFPLIKSDKMWAGYGFNLSMIFYSPYENTLESNRKYVTSKGLNPEDYIKKPKICWYTNLVVKKRLDKIILTKEYSEDVYTKYDNYDAIDVPAVLDIPYNYDGLMGVPISFLDKCNPEQFEIVGVSDIPETIEGVTRLGEEWISKYKEQGGTGHYTANMKSIGITRNGVKKIVFSRLIIRNKEYKNGDNV